MSDLSFTQTEQLKGKDWVSFIFVSHHIAQCLVCNRVQQIPAEWMNQYILSRDDINNSY